MLFTNLMLSFAVKPSSLFIAIDIEFLVMVSFLECINQYQVRFIYMSIIPILIYTASI